MLSRNEIKYIQSLCQKKNRLSENLFIAEGPKILDELIQGDYVIRNIYALPSYTPSRQMPVQEITDIELKRISNLQTPSQVIAVVEQKKNSSGPVLKGKWSLLLDGIQDPGNLGTIIRIADWFGIEQIICSDDTVELYNPKVIQSTMGSFVRVKLWYDEPALFLKNANVPVLGALLKGKDIRQLEKTKEGLLVIGNESKGISEKLLPYISHPVTIPRIGGAESLNAAVAAGIILSHIT